MRLWYGSLHRFLIGCCGIDENLVYIFLKIIYPKLTCGVCTLGWVKKNRIQYFFPFLRYRENFVGNNEQNFGIFFFFFPTLFHMHLHSRKCWLIHIYILFCLYCGPPNVSNHLAAIRPPLSSPLCHLLCQ